jgi:hypothetical protein
MSDVYYSHSYITHRALKEKYLALADILIK